jgi:hypothetical protein
MRKVRYRCQHCGRLQGGKVLNQKSKIVGPVTIHGCRIVERKSSGRCSKYGECPHFLDCLNFVTEAQWRGWRIQS